MRSQETSLARSVQQAATHRMQVHLVCCVLEAITRIQDRQGVCLVARVALQRRKAQGSVHCVHWVSIPTQRQAGNAICVFRESMLTMRDKPNAYPVHQERSHQM